MDNQDLLREYTAADEVVQLFMAAHPDVTEEEAIASVYDIRGAVQRGAEVATTDANREAIEKIQAILSADIAEEVAARDAAEHDSAADAPAEGSADATGEQTQE